MSNFRRAMIGLLAWCWASAIVWADPPVTLPPDPPVDLSGPLPSDNAVQLPPQVFDTHAKGPNCNRERRGQWTISGGVYFLQPVFNTNPAFVVTSPVGGVSHQVDFGHHLEGTAQVWLGYVGERGWGIRTRWYEFESDATQHFSSAPGETVRGVSVFAPAQAQVSGIANAFSTFTVNVLDVQATYTHDGARWSFLSACGVRYSHMSQDYRTNITSPATNIQLVSGHNFNGAGPSFAFDAKRRIGESGFSLYGNLYGAILFGNAKDAQTAVTNGTPLGLFQERTNVIPVGEVELGAEYCRNAGRANLFMQCGFIGQVWWGGGNASNLDAIGPTSASNHNFGLLGLSLRAGVRF